MNDISGKELGVVGNHKLLAVPLSIGRNLLALDWTQGRVLIPGQDLEQDKTTAISEAERWIFGKVIAISMCSTVSGSYFSVVEVGPDDTVNVTRICGMKCHDLMIWYSTASKVCFLSVKLLLQVLVDHIIYVVNLPFCTGSASPDHGIVPVPEVGCGNHELHPFGVIWVIVALGFQSDLFT